MTDTPEKPDANDTSTWLTHQWVVAGIVSSASRFIPIPFVDELVRDQCRKFVVSRTLSAHGRDDPLTDLKPYYATNSGCVAGCLVTLAKAPIKLLLFPVRKIIALLTSVRGVPLEIMRMVLLGRTLDRQLRMNANSTTAQQAAQMRIAFDESFARMDFHVIRAAMADALSNVSGWKTAEIVDSSDITDRQIESGPKVDASATQVQQVLDRPETLELFVEFDQRFDDAMKRLA